MAHLLTTGLCNDDLIVRYDALRCGVLQRFANIMTLRDSQRYGATLPLAWVSEYLSRIMERGILSRRFVYVTTVQPGHECQPDDWSLTPCCSCQAHPKSRR